MSRASGFVARGSLLSHCQSENFPPPTLHFRRQYGRRHGGLVSVQRIARLLA